MERYSILGFSDGGRVALVMGSLYPKEIQKIVAWSCSSFISDAEKNSPRESFDINNWGPSHLAEMQAVYGDELQSTWDHFSALYRAYTDIFKSELEKIECPVFILHGEYDNMLSVEHAQFLKANIKNSELYIQNKGMHNFHIKSHAMFNMLVQQFLLE